MQTVYLDNAASTKIDPLVLKAMEPYLIEKYGNASSSHHKGSEAKDALDQARKIIAKEINACAEEIVFTGSGTESNNFCLKGIAFANNKNLTNHLAKARGITPVKFFNKGKRNHIIVSKIEHDCIMNSCKWLEKQGFDITYLDVDKEGFIDLEKLEDTITSKTILVSIIHGNNEIGTIQDIGAIGNICRKHKVYFHTDACQSFTKIPIDVVKQNIDLMTLNAHKIHGPKGVGALYIKKGIKITPLLHGGGHEFGLRSGTENIPAIVGFGKAVQIANKKDADRMATLRDKLIDGILRISDTRLNGNKEKRLCNNANFSFSYVEGEAIGALLDIKGICSSTGSACSANTLEPSHVLTAIGLKPEQAHGSLRLSLSKFTTEQEIEYVLKVLPEIIERLRSISPFAKKEIKRT